jgi:hypothetical protein
MKSTIEINGPTTDYSLRETLASAGTLPYFEDHLQTLHPDNRAVAWLPAVGLLSSSHQQRRKTMVTFPNRVLFVGFGAVARCTLPILIKHLSVDPKRITIIDFDPTTKP